MANWRAIYDLFGEVWPGTPQRIRLASRLGWRWDEVSTPFSLIQDGEAIAHTGVLALDMGFDGDSMPVASVHAVCTRPGHRGAGHARRQLEAALAHIDAHFPAAQLSTDKPGMYEPYGFREIELNRFRVPAPIGLPRKPLSPLSHRRPHDVELVHRLLEEREDVSEVCSPRRTPWLVGINAVLFWNGFDGRPGGLAYDDELDALVAWEDHEDVVRILDIAAPVLPDLDELLAAIPGGWTWAELCFTPDRWDIDAEPVDWDDDEVFMVRGDWPVPEEPFAVSPLWMT